MHRLTPSFAAGRRSGGAGKRLATATLAAGLITGSLAVSAQAADAAQPVQVKIRHQALIVKGTAARDRIALRLSATDRQTLEVDVGDNGSADFRVARNRFRSIRVDARGGDDLVRIDEANGAFTTTTPTQLNGQRGNDTLIGGSADTLNGGDGNDNLVGGSGNETLIGGYGNDVADGNQGADVALLGAGNDRFTWDPGDGSDVVEGQAGHDAMTFNGSNAAEQFDVSANVGRVRFSRDVGNITMDLNGVEEIDTNALGGADQLTVGKLAGTDLTTIKTDLAGSGGAADDGSADQVVVLGTNGPDVITAAGNARRVSVTRQESGWKSPTPRRPRTNWRSTPSTATTSSTAPDSRRTRSSSTPMAATATTRSPEAPERTRSWAVPAMTCSTAAPASTRSMAAPAPTSSTSNRRTPRGAAKPGGPHRTLKRRVAETGPPARDATIQRLIAAKGLPSLRSPGIG